MSAAPQEPPPALESHERRRSRHRYLLGLCVFVCGVFLVAGQIVYRSVETLEEKAEEQFAAELLNVERAVGRHLAEAMHDLEAVAAQPVMLGVLDEDLDNEVASSLKSARDSSSALLEIDCFDAAGKLVTSTVVERLERPAASPFSPFEGLRGRWSFAEKAVSVAVPIEWSFDEVERIGYLRAEVDRAALLPAETAAASQAGWVLLSDASGDFTLRSGRSAEGDDERMVLRSTLLHFPSLTGAPELTVTLAKPFGTLFGRSLALKTRVQWVWFGSALVLGLVLLTFARLEANYKHGLETYADELQAKNRDLSLSRSQLQEQTRRAQVASRAKSEFLATMSHELRTPLNGILGMTDLLKETKLRGTQREFAETVEDSAAGLLSIIDGILEYSDLEAGADEPPLDVRSPRATVDALLARFRARGRAKGLSFAALVRTRVPWRARYDEGRVMRVLDRLLDNALKFTAKGRVVLELDVSAAHELEFRVSDTGIGVAPERLADVFEPFVQTDGTHARRFGGAGLGLAIAKGLCEAMGGRLSVESRAGGGSSFGFTVPFQPDASEAVDETARVLLLVPDLEAARATAEALVGVERACEVAFDAEEAAGALARGTFALVLADLKHAGRAVFDELARLVPEQRRPRFVGLDASGTVEAAAVPGAALVLAAPLDPGEWSRVCGVDPPRATSDSTAMASGVRADGPTERCILVAEDNPVNQRLMAAWVERLGYACQIAADGRAAVAAFETGAYLCVLMDIQMPEMDGLEATRQIRALESRGERRTPIIAVTANSADEDRQRGLAAGMDAYLGKPVDRSLLAETIARFVA